MVVINACSLTTWLILPPSRVVIKLMIFPTGIANTMGLDLKISLGSLCLLLMIKHYGVHSRVCAHARVCWGEGVLSVKTPNKHTTSNVHVVLSYVLLMT